MTDLSVVEPADILVSVANQLAVTRKFALLPLAEQLLAGCMERVRSDTMTLALLPLTVVRVAIRIDVLAFTITIIVSPVTCDDNTLQLSVYT